MKRKSKNTSIQYIQKTGEKGYTKFLSNFTVEFKFKVMWKITCNKIQYKLDSSRSLGKKDNHVYQVILVAVVTYSITVTEIYNYLLTYFGQMWGGGALNRKNV